MKKIFKKEKILVLTIILLSSVLRIWNLASFPAGLNADEAAIGYNAYSLIETGLDEHGDAWPIHFKSFADYKPGFYFYLSLPFVKAFGLNEWAVRLPSCFLGIISVYFLYLLIRKVFKDKNWALFSSFLLAISPWHIHFSRGGWEANAATTFILIGVYLFFKGFKKPKWFLSSMLFFVFSLYTYHSARLIVPLLGLGLVLFYRNQVFSKKNIKMSIISFLLLIALSLSLAKSFFSESSGVSRFSGVGLMADIGPLSRINELRGQHADPASFSSRALHNKVVAYTIAFFENWLDHFHGEFLFVSGDVIKRSSVPETGQLYLFEIITLSFGIFFLLSKRPKNWQMIFLWIVVAPVAAALTFQTPHALRSHNMVIPLTAVSGLGFYKLVFYLKKKLSKNANICFLLIFSVISLWSVSRYLINYYVHYPLTFPFAWEYGFKGLIERIEPEIERYDKIYVTDRYDQPYILFLFYLKFPPEEFQSQVKLSPRDEYGFSTVKSFDKFYFGEINWDKLKDEKNILVIGTAEEIPKSDKIEEIFYERDNLFGKGKAKALEPTFRIARL